MVEDMQHVAQHHAWAAGEWDCLHRAALVKQDIEMQLVPFWEGCSCLPLHEGPSLSSFLHTMCKT